MCGHRIVVAIVLNLGWGKPGILYDVHSDDSFRFKWLNSFRLCLEIFAAATNTEIRVNLMTKMMCILRGTIF